MLWGYVFHAWHRVTLFHYSREKQRNRRVNRPNFRLHRPRRCHDRTTKNHARSTVAWNTCPIYTRTQTMEPSQETTLHSDKGEAMDTPPGHSTDFRLSGRTRRKTGETGPVDVRPEPHTGRGRHTPAYPGIRHCPIAGRFHVRQRHVRTRTGREPDVNRSITTRRNMHTTLEKLSPHSHKRLWRNRTTTRKHKTK